VIFYCIKSHPTHDEEAAGDFAVGFEFEFEFRSDETIERFETIEGMRESYTGSANLRQSLSVLLVFRHIYLLSFG